MNAIARRHVGLGLMAIGLQAWLFTSCQRTPREEYEQRVDEAGQPLQHAIHSERLTEIMKGLERLNGEKLPQEVDPEPVQQRRIAEIIEVAGAMEESAAHIPDVLGDVELSKERRSQFVAMADELGALSRELKEKGKDLNVAEINAEMEKIRGVCQSCHQKFRILPEVSGS